MNKLLLVVVVGLVALTGFEVTGTAKPCPPDYPGCRRPHPPPPPPPPPPPAIVTTIYQRTEPATPPAKLDRASLVRLLAASPWTRLGSREQIRFVDPTPGTGHFARPPDTYPSTPSRDRSIRAVAIDVIRDRGGLLVNIDGDLYSVTACAMRFPAGARAVMMTTCLEHREAGGSFGGQGYGGITYGGRR